MRESREAPRADGDPVADEPSPACPQLSVHQDQRGAEKASRQASLRRDRHGHREPAPPASRAENCFPPAARAGARGPLDNTRQEVPRPAVGSWASAQKVRALCPWPFWEAPQQVFHVNKGQAPGLGGAGEPGDSRERGSPPLPTEACYPHPPRRSWGSQSPSPRPPGATGQAGVGGASQTLWESSVRVHLQVQPPSTARTPSVSASLRAVSQPRLWGGGSHTQTPVQTPSASVTAPGRPSPWPTGHPPSNPQGWVVQQDADNVQQAGQQLQGEVEQPDPQACRWGWVGEAVVRAPGAAGTLHLGRCTRLS